MDGSPHGRPGLAVVCARPCRARGEPPGPPKDLMQPWIFMVEQTFQLCREISAERKHNARSHRGEKGSELLKKSGD